MSLRLAAITILILSFLAAPLPSLGQQPGKVYRIGYLVNRGPAPTEQPPQQCPMKGGVLWQAWIAGLREHGYVQGQNLVIECRYTEARTERAPALAAELVSLKPDLLIAYSTANVLGAKQATSTIPIVMLGVIAPVERGLVASLARPGGNVTGLTYNVGAEIIGKYLQFLKEAIPSVSRVAVLRHPGGSGLPAGAYPPLFARESEVAAQALGLTLQPYDVRAAEEFAGTFAAMTKAKVEALVVEPTPFLALHAQRIVDLAAQTRLPAVYPDRDFFKAGGLMSYDVNEADIFRRLGVYVDKIFHGANPGDLPVEQPTKFDLLINLKTAKALGLTIPPSLLMRADEVIQ